MIEFDDAGWFFDGDHIHSIVRDKHNNFNENILKNHYNDKDGHHHHGGGHYHKH